MPDGKKKATGGVFLLVDVPSGAIHVICASVRVGAVIVGAPHPFECPVDTNWMSKLADPDAA